MKSSTLIFKRVTLKTTFFKFATNRPIDLDLFLAYCEFVFPYNDPPVLSLDEKYNFVRPKTIRFLSKF